MNSNLKNSIAAGLLSVFLLATASLFSRGYVSNSQNGSLEQCEGFSTVFTGHLPGAALQPEKPVSFSAIRPGLTAKNFFTGFFALLPFADHFITGSFAQHTSDAAKAPSQLSKTAIIFPFHNFW